jgi:hypothetical protein
MEAQINPPSANAKTFLIFKLFVNLKVTDVEAEVSVKYANEA